MRKVVFRLAVVVVALLLVAPTGIIAQGPVTQNLAQTKTIYVVPMRGGLDHYVTNELVQWGRFQITMDPQQANALLTETTKVNIRAIMTDPQKVPKAFSTRGTLFLIDPRTLQVLWSVYKKPNEPFILGGDKSNPELAHDMISAFRKDLGAQNQK
jgi:hypothetical protein